MFPFKANAFSFVVNKNVDTIKADLKKRIKYNWLLDPQWNTRWTGKIKKNAIILQKESSGGRTFHPVIIFTLEELTGKTTRVIGYFCFSLAKWLGLLLMFGVGIYVSWDVKRNLLEPLLFASLLLVVTFFIFLRLYFTFRSDHKMWISELRTILAADVSKQIISLPLKN